MKSPINANADTETVGPADAVLIARVLTAQDRHAFAVLVRRHQGPVRALLRKLTHGDEALADDLAQETFLQAYRKLAQFRADARFSTWLYRVAYNIFLQHIRAQKPEESLDDQQAADESESTIVAPGDPTPAHEVHADMQMDLQRAMARLSAAERAVLTQCYYLDRSHEEAAYVLGCPVGTVKSHILRAKQKLKGALQAWEARYS